MGRMRNKALCYIRVCCTIICSVRTDTMSKWFKVIFELVLGENRENFAVDKWEKTIRCELSAVIFCSTQLFYAAIENRVERVIFWLTFERN